VCGAHCSLLLKAPPFLYAQLEAYQLKPFTQSLTFSWFFGGGVVRSYLLLFARQLLFWRILPVCKRPSKRRAAINSCLSYGPKTCVSLLPISFCFLERSLTNSSSSIVMVPAVRRSAQRLPPSPNPTCFDLKLKRIVAPYQINWLVPVVYRTSERNSVSCGMHRVISSTARMGERVE
jgi:hypothetical protein